MTPNNAIVKHRIIDQGGYADIIAIDGGRVVKAFRRTSHGADAVRAWADCDAVTRGIFRAEARAYERLQAFPTLALYAPQFFGRVDPAKFWPDVNYVPGCGLLLEHIPGRAVKLNRLDQDLELRVSAIVEEFRDKLGIDNVWDASCFVSGTRAPFTVVDFAYWHAEEYEMALCEAGCLSKASRERLEGENAD